MRTIEVAVELVEEMREWSEPVRVRFVDDPVPMLEFQTVTVDWEAALDAYDVDVFGWHHSDILREHIEALLDAALGGGR